jgi:hypothetical protein
VEDVIIGLRGVVALVRIFRPEERLHPFIELDVPSKCMMQTSS